VETLAVALRVILSLAVVLGLLWWLHRRLSRGPRVARSNPISVVTRQSISPKASVVVVEVDGQRLVLGVTEQSITVLQSSEAAVPEKAADFAASLDTATLDAAAASTANASAPAPVVTLVPAAVTTGESAPALAGSILSLHTWKQAAATLRRAR
jgi:flagellar protein FliO/FliZ